MASANSITTSSGFPCEITCDRLCKDLNHEPNYKTFFLNFAPSYPVTPSCNQCFVKYLTKFAELVEKVCCNYVRSDILGQAFLVVCRSDYNDLISNFIECRNSHQNPPPDFFCVTCFQKVLRLLVSSLEEYGLIINSAVTVELSLFFNYILISWSNCNECFQ